MRARVCLCLHDSRPGREVTQAAAEKGRGGGRWRGSVEGELQTLHTAAETETDTETEIEIERDRGERKGQENHRHMKE